MKFTASAPAFDATFSGPDQLRKGLKAEDLPELTALQLDVDQTDATTLPRRIAITFERPPKQSGKDRVSVPSVKLFVTGPERDWVDLATTRLTERLDQGERATEKVGTFLVLTAFVAGLTAVGLLAGLGDHKKGLNAAEVASIVLGCVAGVALLLYLSLNVITPQLELVPEGGITKWERLKGRVNISGRWLLDAVVKAGIGALIVVLIERSF